jgi:hypothetical protein
MALRDAGWGVCNYAVSLGHPEAQGRRLAELREACRRARFELIVPDEPLAISSDDDLLLAEEDLVDRLSALLSAYDLVISPSPHDRHHGHEVVGRAVRRALEQDGVPTRWWMWGLWSDLPFPNVICDFGPERLAEVTEALSAHAGDLGRTDYRRLVEGRARSWAVLGPERIFGFGQGPPMSSEGAEVVCEAVRRNGSWLLGTHRLLDPTQALSIQPTEASLGFWLNSLSLATQMRLLTKDLLEDLFRRDSPIEGE